MVLGWGFRRIPELASITANRVPYPMLFPQLGWNCRLAFSSYEHLLCHSCAPSATRAEIVQNESLAGYVYIEYC
jgi:hypothetical protein